MSSAPVTSGLTWEEYINLPDEPRYRHVELIDGELVPKHAPLVDGGQVLVNPPSWLHQRVVTRLVIAIGNWVESGVGRGDVTEAPPVRIAGVSRLPARRRVVP